MIATGRIKNQGRALEISSIIIEQNFDKCRQQVQGWEEGFLSCSRDLQNSCVLDGCNLFGQDLQIQSNSQEEPNNGFRMGDVNTSKTNISLNDLHQIKCFGDIVPAEVNWGEFGSILMVELLQWQPDEALTKTIYYWIAVLVPYFSLTKASTSGNLRRNTSIEGALSNGFGVAAGMELKPNEEQVYSTQVGLENRGPEPSCFTEWDPGGDYYTASILSSYFKVWDPGGGSLLFQQYCFAFQIITLRTR